MLNAVRAPLIFGDVAEDTGSLVEELVNNVVLSGIL
jgi:hypothetical protein